MEEKIYNQEGKETGTIKLPDAVFGVSWNDDLVFEVVSGMMANRRNSTAHAKGRGEVRGGGKKPWRQKGTGRARHGSTRSPIWVGGGVTHGPLKEKNYSQKINKKKKAKALFSVLSKKLADREILFLNSLDFSEPRTKKAREVLDNLSKIPGLERVAKKKNALVVAVDKSNTNAQKSFRNFGNIVLEDFKNLNPLLLLQNKYLIIVNPENVLKEVSVNK